MLKIPNVGIKLSVNKHNCRLDTLCDWVEGSLFFEDEELSTNDVVDALTEEEIYRDQEFAFEMVYNVWNELRRRFGWIRSDSPFVFRRSDLIRKTVNWEEVPGHSFCLVASLSRWYEDWTTDMGGGYSEQGALFEELTKESLEAQLPDWKIHQTGWSSTNASRLAAVVESVASKLGESIGDVGKWSKPTAKDGGLDMLCFRPFPDGRTGFPVYLMQCSSGDDWEDKLGTPDLEEWCNYITFTAKPQRAFSMPFAITDNDYWWIAGKVKGLFFDRYRLLAATHFNSDWVSENLKHRLIDWIRPRIETLPKSNR